MRWLRYVVIAIPALWLAYASASYALTRLVPGPDYTVGAFGSGFAPMIYADRQLPTTLDDIDASKLLKTARRSLESEPLNPRAVRAFALNARSQKNTESLLRYADLSQRLSRRDVLNQLLLIDGKAKDPGTKIEDILVHYDNILRVAPRLTEQLYPALVGVMANQQAFDGIAAYVIKKRPWAESLMFEALPTEYGPNAVVEILKLANKGKKIDPSDRLSKTLFDRLYAQGDYSTAKSLFLRMKDVEPEWLSSTKFVSARWQDKYGPLVWQFSNDANSGADLVPGRDAGNPAIEVFALSGVRGTPLRRLLFLKPGNYKFTQEYEVFQSGMNADAGWTLVCVGKAFESGQANELMSVSTDVGNTQKKMTHASDVKITCPVQHLRFSVAGGDGQSGLTMRLSEANFTES
ncbi:hypothetical protein [uncultured Parasphingorhabdus sp.]|uniref:hypothetical protein n=1 Tax=uncultured Parasphingorhabdus sp. TaxID=2709694 RepID=UPI0030DCD643|tara:strand:- start:34453 stop:35670 length:1218 start_codon:yes stop_codon:yes gene_type:complete